VPGATNWMSPSFSPATGLFYVTTREVCSTYFGWPQQFQEGQYYFGGTFQRYGGRGYGAVRAIDPATATVKWEFKHFSPSTAGILSTASGLVFASDADGNFVAIDGATGKHLWHFQTGSAIFAAPTTYMLGGRQYVVIPSGTTFFAFALPDS